MRVVVVAKSEEQAERIAQDSVKYELAQGNGHYDAWPLRHLHDVDHEWKRAIPYGDAEGKSVRDWMRMIVGAE